MNPTMRSLTYLLIASASATFFSPLCPAQSPAPKPATPKAVVESDLLALETAITACALDTTYFVSLETLNDRSGGPTLDPLYDYLNHEGGTYVIRPTDGLFRTTRINLLTAFNAWGGPYVNYQPGNTQLGVLPYDQGSPLDPWGNPYLFYTPMGLVRGDIGAITLEYHADNFDRPTVACLGPDGVVSSDDVFRHFGTGIQPTAISSLRGPSVAYRTATNDFIVPNSQPIQIKGYNFSASQGTSEVRFGALDLTPHITAWSNTLISLQLPAGLHGEADITVVRSGAPTNKQRLTILANSTTDWLLYN